MSPDDDRPRFELLTRADGLEVLRIVRVCAKEWLRSGRLPPGRPHRPTLLQPASVGVALVVDGARREGRLPLDPATPLYRALGELGGRLAAGPPSLTIEDLAHLTIEVEIDDGLDEPSREDLPQRFSERR